VSLYTVYVTRGALREIKDLPGQMRHRVKRAIDELANTPQPSDSKVVELPEELGFDVTLCRLRLDKWRIVYAVTESQKIIDVLAVRKRPPYDYGDLQALLSEIQ